MPAKGHLSLSQKEKLVKRLLNEGKLIINWSRKLKNKGNAINVI